MKIEIMNDKELTNEILDRYSIGDVLLFSSSSPGAQGERNHIEAIFKIGDTLELYSGVHKDEGSLTTRKVEEFFYPITIDDLINTGWYFFNMGLGNGLFIRDLFLKPYLEKYEYLVLEFPFFLYETWRKFTEYVMNEYFNNIKDVEKLIEVDKTIDDLRDEYSY